MSCWSSSTDRNFDWLVDPHQLTSALFDYSNFVRAKCLLTSIASMQWVQHEFTCAFLPSLVFWSFQPSIRTFLFFVSLLWLPSLWPSRKAPPWFSQTLRCAFQDAPHAQHWLVWLKTSPPHVVFWSGLISPHTWSALAWFLITGVLRAMPRLAALSGHRFKSCARPVFSLAPDGTLTKTEPVCSDWPSPQSHVRPMHAQPASAQPSIYADSQLTTVKSSISLEFAASLVQSHLRL